MTPTNGSSTRPVSSSSLKRENVLIFKEDQANKYIKRVPFWKRHLRVLSIGGAVACFCILYSAPIYYFFRDPSKINPENTLWPGERIRGKTYVEQLRERVERNRKRRDELLAENTARKEAAKLNK